MKIEVEVETVWELARSAYHLHSEWRVEQVCGKARRSLCEERQE
jgi:hypothetical protein